MYVRMYVRPTALACTALQPPIYTHTPAHMYVCVCMYVRPAALASALLPDSLCIYTHTYMYTYTHAKRFMYVRNIHMYVCKYVRPTARARACSPKPCIYTHTP